MELLMMFLEMVFSWSLIHAHFLKLNYYLSTTWVDNAEKITHWKENYVILYIHNLNYRFSIWLNKINFATMFFQADYFGSVPEKIIALS